MQDNLLGLAREWETNWQAGVDEQFINPQSTYLDLAKQVTCIDHGLPYDELVAEWEAQTGLFRKCCVYKMLDHRKQWAAATAKQKKQPPPTQRTDGYVWANVMMCWMLNRLPLLRLVIVLSARMDWFTRSFTT